MKKFIAILSLSWSVIAGVAAAAEEPKPQQPDPEYCARRDSDQEKCVIQDGPPPKPIVRKKQSQPK